MNAATFEILKDMFIPIPYAIWVNKGDRIIIKKSLVDTFKSWTNQDAVQKDECICDSKQPFILIKAKTICENIKRETFLEESPVDEFPSTVSNRSMKGRRKRIRTK